MYCLKIRLVHKLCAVTCEQRNSPQRPAGSQPNWNGFGCLYSPNPGPVQLYLDSFGAFLAVRQGTFLVRLREAGEHTFPTRQVQSILLTKGTAMSADALLLAVEHDIPVLLIDANTHHPLAQVYAGRPGSIATIRKNQALFARQPEGMAWVASVIAQKIERQRQLLRTLADDPEVPPEWCADMETTDRVIAGLQRSFAQWTPPAVWNAEAHDKAAGAFRGQEGTASRLYFQQLTKRLDGRLGFEGRQKRPAYDPFNALLNYLYGMLYTHVHLALLKAGLDPYLGVLHADQYGDRPTLVYDFIEPYRPWADAVAVALALEGLVDEPLFETLSITDGLWLSRKGKDLVIGRMLRFLDNPARYNGRMVKHGVQVDLDAQSLAVMLKT